MLKNNFHIKSLPSYNWLILFMLCGITVLSYFVFYPGGLGAGTEVSASSRTYTSDHASLVAPTIKPISLQPAVNHTCFVTTDQLPYCIGDNYYGMLGNGTTNNSTVAVKFQLPAGKLALDMSTSLQSFSCAVTTDQLVYCAGSNNGGQFGDGTTTNRLTPVLFQLPVGKLAVKVKTSYEHFWANTCVLTMDQLVYCAGKNEFGQVGNATTVPQLTPVLFQLPAGKAVQTMSVGRYNVCVLTTDHLMYCAGYNGEGGIGDSTTVSPRSTPLNFPLPAGKFVAAADTGMRHNCALTTEGQIYCAGRNEWSQLGDGTTTLRSAPVLYILPAGKKAAQVNADSYQTCALTTDQFVYCSGLNTYGELSNGTTAQQSTPVLFQLPAGKNAAALSTADYRNYALTEYDTPTNSHNCVLTTDQLVYCAGLNANGELGDGTTASRATAVQFQLPAGKKAAKVITAYAQTCVITTDQLVYCAGYNSRGQLGNGTTGTILTPPAMFKFP